MSPGFARGRKKRGERSRVRVIEIDHYGPPEALTLAEHPDLQPGPGTVRVRVHAAAVNPADFKWRSGALDQVVPLSFPAVLGYDIAGTVDALGPGVTAPAVGTRVVGMLNHLDKGGYAERVLLPAEQAVPIPDALDFATAAALPTAGLTGVQAVEDVVRPAPGETLLVTGALGGVGRFAVHAALARGARVVAAVRAGQIADALALGASEAVVLDDVWTAGPIDHVVDTIGGDAVAALCRHVRPGGRIAYVGTTPIPPEGLAIPPVFVIVRHDPARLAALARAAAVGDLTVPVTHRLPLADAAEAHRLVEAGGTNGKVVLLA